MHRYAGSDESAVFIFKCQRTQSSYLSQERTHMIYTVTLNPAVDKTVKINHFQTGEVNRVQWMRQDPGGKGINVSKVIASLGGKSVAMGIVAGNTGKWIEETLRTQGIETLLSHVSGQTRTNLKIIDEACGQNTDINEPGTEVGEEDLNRVLSLLTDQLEEGDSVVLAGSLPKGAKTSLYAEWIEVCKKKGAKVYLDADGERLKAGIQACPFFIKPNAKEIEELLGYPVETEAQLVQAALDIHKGGIPCVTVSLGGEGALFVYEGKVYRGQGIRVPVGSTVGAGDSMVAALAYGMEQGMEVTEAMRLALATSAANVMCDGSQPANISQVKELLPRAQVTENRTYLGRDS